MFSLKIEDTNMAHFITNGNIFSKKNIEDDVNLEGRERSKTQICGLNFQEKMALMLKKNSEDFKIKNKVEPDSEKKFEEYKDNQNTIEDLLN